MSDELATMLRWAQAYLRDESQPTTEEIDAMLLPSARMTAHERLQLHRNQHWAQLQNSLNEQFPQLVRFMGAPAFNILARHYLREHPLRSYTANHLKAGLPAMIASTTPEFKYQGFILDLARLEVASSLAAWAPREKFLTPEQMQSVAWDHGRLVPIQAARLLDLQYPVLEFTQHTGPIERAEWDRKTPNWLLILRPALTILNRPVSEEEFHLIQAAASGSTAVPARSGRRGEATDQEASPRSDAGASGSTAVPARSGRRGEATDQEASPRSDAGASGSTAVPARSGRRGEATDQEASPRSDAGASGSTAVPARSGRRGEATDQEASPRSDEVAYGTPWRQMENADWARERLSAWIQEGLFARFIPDA